MDLVSWLRHGGVARGELCGVSISPDGVCSVAVGNGGTGTGPVVTATAGQVALADAEIRPRWATWSQETAQRLVASGVRLSTCWDVAAVHRLRYGGWRADPGYVLALLAGAPEPPPPAGELGTDDLFSAAGERPAEPEYGAAQALAAATAQRDAIRDGADAVAMATALSESTVELLCAELTADGLPMDRVVAEGLLEDIVGPRPRGAAAAAAIRAARDERVLRHAPTGVTADLRSNGQVRALLAAAGIDVPDTRAWRLEEFRERSELVAALLEWRKAERIATTYGYSWLDDHLGADGRLRGAWTGCDGAAGRMTASNGLHNMPAVLRQGVLAAPGHLLVRADLGQIEPRVLAAVSGDAALAQATMADDMYLPVAAALGVDRPTAKVAMIGAMYGQTTGHGGVAARRMRSAYQVAMGYLDAGDRAARARHDLRTYGGRLVRMSGGADADGTEDGASAARSAARTAARGRYGRNALIQGAAAELFKMWAVTVRARGAPLDARIVLCLHDELLVLVPADRAPEAAALVGECLAETSRRWAPGGQVRFIADISVLRSWAEAKG